MSRQTVSYYRIVEKLGGGGMGVSGWNIDRVPRTERRHVTNPSRAGDGWQVATGHERPEAQRGGQ